MQHKNLLKQLTLALLMTVAVPYAKSQVAHVGDILCTSGVYVSPAEYEASGLEAMGVVFYVDATGQHGWAVALEDAGSFGWGPTSDDTPLSNFTSLRAAIYDLDGLFNTQEILSYGVSNNKSFPAFEAVDVTNGWYLPAIGQLNYLYGNLVEVNVSLSTVGGMIFDMSGIWEYWSSTEYASHYAWSLCSSGRFYAFISSGSNYYTKPGSRRVRGVRNF
jgi:hypothetical protein